MTGELANTLTTRKWAVHSRTVAALVLLVLCGSTHGLPAQDSPSFTRLAKEHFKSGDQTLRAFASVSSAVRDSVVKLDLNGTTVALGAVIDEAGLVVTKNSEIKQGKLTCWLARGVEVDAELISRDQENDLALVKVHAKGLKPIQWATDETAVGQWVVTPGIIELPQAIGIVSVPMRRIVPRAFIGVHLDEQASTARIDRVLPGLGAEKAGLKSGDIILALDGKPIKEGEALISRLRQYREGQTVNLRVQREEQEFDAAIELRVPKQEGGRRGFDRAAVMNRMGSELSKRAGDFELAIQHDTVLQAWQCGGPLLNLEGKAVGLNIARAARVASYALPADLVKQAIQNLKARPATKDRLTN